jgi:GH15 family glucan-1,4-alpha-glucosidase
MCRFWLAHIYALRGGRGNVAAILQRAEVLAGRTGLFSKAVDARTPTLIGNMPLLFRHTDYAKAALALGRKIHAG